MKLFRRIKHLFTQTDHTLLVALISTCKYWPDKLYISLYYRLTFHRKLNWKNPQTFNEKLSWLKLYGRNDQYTRMADKYEVKQFVAERIGKEYVVENYVLTDSWDKIDFAKLPNQFVIKCTHDSGGAFVCRNKATFDHEGTRQIVEHNFQRNYFYPCREWPYKNIKPRIIVDRFLDDHTGNELRDYKWWCFNGVPAYMYCTIKGKDVFENFYDMDFQPVAIDHGFPRHQPEFERPTNFELMKELAAKLSKDIPFVRVDFFDVDGNVYFGEFTFYDWAGLRPFGGDWDEKLGGLINLPR